jgi:uncharacterized membrane protein YesL
MHDLASGDAPGVRDFLRAVRVRFLAAWAWAAWSAAVVAVVVANVAFYLDAGGSLQVVAGAVGVVGILLAVSVLYVWPFVFLQSDGGLGRAIRNSILTSLAAPFFSLTIALLLAVVVVASFVLVLPLGLFTPGFVCLVASHAVSNRLRAFGKLPALPVLEDAE